MEHWLNELSDLKLEPILQKKFSLKEIKLVLNCGLPNIRRNGLKNN